MTSPQCWHEVLVKASAFNLHFHYSPQIAKIIDLLEESLSLLHDTISLLQVTKQSSIYGLSITSLFEMYSLQMSLKLYYLSLSQPKEIVSLDTETPLSINYLKLYSTHGKMQGSLRQVYLENTALGLAQFPMVPPLLKTLMQQMDSWYLPYAAIYLLVYEAGMDYMIEIKWNSGSSRRALLDLSWFQRYFNELPEIRVIECWENGESSEPSLKFIR